MAEALPQSVASAFFAQYSQKVRLMETYASSEVQGSNAFLSTEVLPDGGTGKFNVRPGQTVILVDHGDVTRKVSVPGESGELLLRPTANGYLDEKQTSMRFIPNPFGQGRLFRSGDLCKWIEVGKQLQLVGRVDFQVKVSGKLVELEHVERAAEGLLGIRQAAARTFVRSSGTMVVALFLSVDGTRRKGFEGERETKEQLALVLPSHAVPATIAFLDEIPLLKNGKKDRNALPVPEEDGEDEMTDSLGMVRAVGQRWAQEFRARQAVCGISVTALLFQHWFRWSYWGPLAYRSHWCPLAYDGSLAGRVACLSWEDNSGIQWGWQDTLFQNTMHVLLLITLRLSMSLLMWTVGYLDARVQKNLRDFFVQCLSVYAVYWFMHWPLVTNKYFGFPTHFRAAYSVRVAWSCKAYTFYRLTSRCLTALRIPPGLQALFMYVVAWHLHSVKIRDCGHYLMGYWLGTVATQAFVERMLRRSKKEAVAAFCLCACAFCVRDSFTEIVEMYGEPNYFDCLYPVRIVMDATIVACIVIFVGEGTPFLRILGQALVGSYITHTTISPDAATFVRWARCYGGIAQLACACLLPIAYILTIGYLAQLLIFQAVRRLQVWK